MDVQDANSPSTVVVSSDINKGSWFKRLFNSHKQLPKQTRIIMLAVGALILVILLWFLVLSPDSAYWRSRLGLGQRVYGKVGSHLVKSSELKNAMLETGPLKTSQDQVLTAILDQWLYTDIGKKYGVKVSDQEVTTEYNQRVGNNAAPAGKNYILVAVRRDLLKHKLEAKFRGFYQGQYIMANFDQHIPFNGNGGPDNPAEGREARIATDRDYATQFINDIYSKLQDKSLIFAQAISNERQDPQIGVTALPTSLHSDVFDTSKLLATNRVMFSRPEILSQISKLQPGQYTKPFIVKINTDLKDPPTTVDGKWMIINLKTSQLPAGKSADVIVKEQKASLGYRKY